MAMISPSNYWTIVLPSGNRARPRIIDEAREYIESLLIGLSTKTGLSTQENQNIIRTLYAIVFSTDNTYSDTQRELALRCFRCYISHVIYFTCVIIIPRKYNISGEGRSIFCADLLPWVLNDDGERLVILNSQDRTQYILNNNGTTERLAENREYFSVSILQTFNPRFSLDSWIQTLTCQHQKIKSELLNCGLINYTNWKFLCNKVTKHYSEILSTRDIEIRNAFQKVYMHDRLRNKQRGRYSDPTAIQLQKILDLLQQENLVQRNIDIQDLLSELQRIATILRRDLIERKITLTEPIENYHDTDNYSSREQELFTYEDTDPGDAELNNFLRIVDVQQKLRPLLYNAIVETLQERRQQLQESRYRGFVESLLLGYRLFYVDKLSLSEIGRRLGMTGNQPTRFFNVSELVSLIRARIIEDTTIIALLDNFLQSLETYRAELIRNNPEELTNMRNLIKEYVIHNIFNPAISELSDSKKARNSLLAQVIHEVLNDLDANT